MPDSVTTLDLAFFLTALLCSLVTIGVLFRRFLVLSRDGTNAE